MTIAIPASYSDRETRPFLLLEMYLDAGTERFTNADREVTWGGNTYYSFPFTIGGITRSAQGIVEKIQLSTSNVTREIAALLLAETFRGKRVVLRRSAFKADHTLDTVYIVFDGLLDDVSGKEGEKSAEIAVSATSDLAFWQKPIPGRTYKATCHWVFKSAECGYAGGETLCNKTWDRCTALANTARFTGFRHLPKLETADIWWGKTAPFPSSTGVPRVLPQ